MNFGSGAERGLIALAMFGAMPAMSGAAMAQSADAKRFGAREGVEQIALSPDGARVVFIAPGPGASSIAYVADVAGGVAPRKIVSSDGNPETLQECRWSSNIRIVCRVFMLVNEPNGLVGYSRMVAMDPDGGNAKMLSARGTSRSLGIAQFGGDVIDWLPDTEGNVLMTRVFVPERTIGTNLADSRRGYGVERVDTGSLRRTTAEQPVRDAVEFITDGHGDIRIMATAAESGGYTTANLSYMYRLAGSRDWKPLSVHNMTERTGFIPVAVDRTLNAAYGFDRLNGRLALYRVSLDGSLKRELVVQRDDVDVDDLIRIGRSQRVVGASYATERREAQFFDPALKKLAASLTRALPGLPLVRFLDASGDENRLLLWAGSDVDPGRYYVFDRSAKKLMEIMLSRPPLESATLGPVKPVTFTAADGTVIPAYLTLPPGSDGKGLPAIVMPHGGPGARDEWGFDWLAQFYAARGFAVLQPNFRGSAGYGESWFLENGFRSWRTAIGDVNDGGRWLVAQGIAAPDKMAILGWSYGGYAALQSGVLDPDLFKAVVAIAPVTDLDMLKGESRYFTNYGLVQDFVGSGPHIAEGSPARNAAKLKAPVLLFHGERDRNVGVGESRLMAGRLREAGKPVEYVEFPGLDHYLADGEVRATMLDRSDAFLRTALKLPPKE